jgi:hypothetical protein
MSSTGRLLSAIATSACLCTAGAASAAEWSAAPTISWIVDHDTNRALSATERSSEGGFLNADLVLRRATPTSNLWLRPRVGFQRYTEEVAQDGESYSLTAAGTWTSDRSQLNALGVFSRDNTYNSELADTGILTGSSERTSKSANLSWRTEHSPRRQLDVALGYSEIQYENQQFFDFFGTPIPFETLYGYRYPSLSVTESVVWSERSSFEVTAYANRLISEIEANDSDTYGARLGFTRALTEHYTARFSAGVSQQVGEEESETGYVGRFELTRTGLLGQWRLYAERNLSPSAYGYLVTRNEAGLAFDRRVTPRWTLTTSLRSVWNEDTAVQQSNERRRFERAEVSTAWAATRTWRLNAGVSWTRSQFVEGAGLAHGWRALLSATWAPQPGRLSR